jgi:hypothetical protein
MNSPSAFRTRGSGRYRVDVGYLFVFMVVLGVLGGVGYHIYSTTRVSVDEIEWPDPLSLGRTKTQQRLAQAVGNVQGPLVIPTATATDGTTAAAPSVVQPAASLEPQPVATRVPPSSIPLAALERAITSPNDAAPANQAPPPPSAGATPQAHPEGSRVANQGRMKIANTGGDGVYVRRTPKMSDRLVAWPDNTPIEFLGETAEGEGTKWSKVRDPRGNVGWVPSQYLAPDASVPAAPIPAPPAPAPALAGSVRAPGPAAPAPAPPPPPARNP